MKQFQVLYKRAKTGKIQYWEIEVLPLTDGAQIVKESGQLGTENPTVYRESITKGKNIGKANETSPAEQAIAQAESDWKKKKDEGYKDRHDLGIDISGDLMHWSFNHVNYKTATEALEAALPQFNTDASGNVKPMLAKTVDWNKVQYPCIVQPKLDGVRCLLVVERDGEGLDVTFLSRKGKEYTTLDHIHNDLLRAGSLLWGLGKVIFDGEIYSHDITFQQITAAVKKENEYTPLLKFRVYDMVNSEDQLSRLREVEQLVKSINSDYITLVECFKAESQDVIKNAHDTWVQQGYEGAMIRHLNGKYGQGQRSSDLLKVKEFDETEFIFECMEQGQREEDLVAVCRTADGKKFKAKITGTRAFKEQLNAECGELQETPITVKHFGWTDAGLPRFPIGKSFRDYE